MSQDQSQFGIYKFNKTNFPKVAALLRAKINDYHNFSYEVAIAAYEAMKLEKIKEDQAFNFLLNPNTISKLSRKVKSSKWADFEIYTELLEFIKKEIYRSDSNKNNPLKPRKSSFPTIPNTAKTISIEFEEREIEIIASFKLQSITWMIASGNHNVDRAAKKFYSKLLFPILKQHKWAKGEGGCTEFCQESDFNPHIQTIHNYGS